MNSLKILLVEDNLALAKSTAKLIERLSKHQVQITDKPETIFELCMTDKVDIVIMDVNLPEASWADKEVSGTDLSRLLKTKPETAHIPIILLTAYAMANEKELLMADSQADEFLTKPVRDYNILIEKIEELVKN